MMLYKLSQEHMINDIMLLIKNDLQRMGAGPRAKLPAPGSP